MNNGRVIEVLRERERLRGGSPFSISEKKLSASRVNPSIVLLFIYYSLDLASMRLTIGLIHLELEQVIDD
jgi:hypothetical protein